MNEKPQQQQVDSKINVPVTLHSRQTSTDTVLCGKVNLKATRMKEERRRNLNISFIIHNPSRIHEAKLKLLRYHPLGWLTCTLSSPHGSSYSQYSECSVTRIVNGPIVSTPSRLWLQQHASGSCDVSPVHQTVGGWLAVTAQPASFLLAQTWLGCHYRSVHARERTPVCLSLQRQLNY